MLVAPTPPTKPTPPVAPTLTPASSHTAADLSPAAAANSSQNSSKPVSTELSGTAKKLDELGKAFQGKPVQTKTGDKTAPAPTTINKTNSIQAAPAASTDSQAVSAQTVVPDKPPVVNSKPSAFSYLPFIGIVGVIAVILVGLRLYKRKTKQQRTLIDYSKRTTAVMNKEGLDIVVTPQTTTPKVKSNFEVRV
ncbi:MAG: hypothetical protein H6Q71_1413 [Firmicutes bacterium]|nr:hypothetical protein [Bacillota bacterium]